MKDRILELAKEIGLDVALEHRTYGLTILDYTEELKDFYKAAHADGMREMREKAVKIGRDATGDEWRDGRMVEAIRNLEIE